MNFHRKAFVATCALALWASAAFAQDYPNRPIRLVVGYPPGGSPDTVARLVGQKVSQTLGQPLVVENRLGGGATVATAFVAKAPADGYTLLLAETAQLEIAPHIYQKLPYDPLKDLAPIALLTTTPILLISSPKTTPEIQTFDDLVRQARVRPGRLDYGSLGIGTIHHIAMETVKAKMRISLTHIPYRGGAFSVAAVMAGEVPVVFTSLSTVASIPGAHLLAVGTKERFPLSPNIPALGEWIPGFDFPSQNGLLAPAGVPAEVINKLSAASKAAMSSPDVLDRLKALSFLATWTTPEGYVQNIQQELAKYATAVKLANIQPE